MDFSKIFIKNATATKIGGQAVMEGIMMKGEDRTAIVVRLPDSSFFIKTEKLKKKSKLTKIPILRGVLIFVDSLITGFRSLMYSAEVLAQFDMDEAQRQEETATEEETPSVKTVTSPEKEGASFKVAMFFSVALALLFTIGIFIVGPTWAINFVGGWVHSEIVLNLIEGFLRIVLFVLYIAAISRMKDIQTVFRFHGAEHKCIHCYENGLPLTPENCRSFETLHPRCGTSFLMFVMVISLLLFSLLGWPNLLVRIASRILFIPLIAGLSYELLRWAGRSDNLAVRILSVPGLLLQRLTTKVPEVAELEVAIASMKAVLVPPDTEVYEGFCDKEGRPKEKDCEEAVAEVTGRD
jgi:uncharacterized protein YqhQ